MNKLMTKGSFNKRLNKLIENNGALLSNAQIDIFPGWIKLLEDTLRIYRNVIGIDNIESTKFIYVGSENNRRLRMLPEIPDNLSAVRIKAGELILNNAYDKSNHICKKCGSSLVESERYNNTLKCLAHEEFDGYFKTDLNSYKRKLSMEKSVGNHDGKDLNVTSKNVPLNRETETIDNHETSASLKIFDMNDVKNLKTNIGRSSVDSDVKSRNKIVFDNLMKRGEYLPFGDLPSENNNIFKILLEDFPNFSETISVIENAVELARIGDGLVKIPNILLLGDPGIGKTFFANSVAKLLNIDYIEIRMENEQNGSALTGSSEFWTNTKTGEIFNILTNGKTANPLVLVDEVDKANGDSRYDPLGGLYSLLEHETAKSFEDQSIKGLKLNATGINWLFTANNIDNVPAPIQSRMLIHEIKNPNFEQSIGIVKKIYKTLKNENKWGKFFNESLPDDVAEKLANYEPRKMKTLLMTAFGSACKAKNKEISVNDIPSNHKVMSRYMGFIEHLRKQ